MTTAATKSLFSLIPSTTLKTSPAHQNLLKAKNFEYFRVFVGPATGPRCWSTFGFDQAFLNHWKAKHDNRRQATETPPCYLVGGSTGAFRFSAILHELALYELYGKDQCRNILEAYSNHYIGMTYQLGDSSS